MNTESSHRNDISTRRVFYYGWIIIAASTILFAVSEGLVYSFGVFFKPIMADFGWSRASTSGVFSTRWIVLAMFAMPLGWLADRFGPAKILGFCSLMVGLGLVLTSKVNALWQLYLAYGLIFGIGASGGFAITTATAARWFVKRRGFALGIVASGTGLGTIAFAPIAERLIDSTDWSKAFLILGIAGGMIMLVCALFLRHSPKDVVYRTYDLKESIIQPDKSNRVESTPVLPEIGISLRDAVRTKLLWMLAFIFFFFTMSISMVMLHIVNYATDYHISPLIAATLLSVIGASGIIGRLTMGIASDKIGANRVIVICCTILTATLAWLILSREPWMFFLFAIVFGFAYGGEVPQLPALFGQYFGLRGLAALVGVGAASCGVGAAIGSWLGGQVFDATGSYHFAFIIASLAAFVSLVLSLILKKQTSLSKL